MELLLLLPLLLGLAAFSFFDGGNDGDDGSGNQTNNQVDNVDKDEDDVVAVGNGTDNTLAGGVGDDFLLGGGGSDTVSGGVGADMLLGESGADELQGGRGFDTLLGGSGNDLLAGGFGDDFLVGGTGNDYVIGDDGDDTLVGSSGADTLQAERGDDLIVSADVDSATEALNVNFGMTDQGAAELAALKKKLDTRFDGDAVYEAVRNPTLLDRVGSALSEAGTSNADDVVFAGNGNDTIVADLSDTVTGGDGLDLINIISGGAGEAVTVKDFTPGEDTINVYVPAGTNPAVSFIDGATPADGLSVVVAGDTVAVLKGMIKANVPADAIVVTVVTA